jgi:hypothetical protein
MQDTITHTKTFKELRNIVKVLRVSVDEHYLPNNYKELCKGNNYEDIIEVCSRSIKIDNAYYNLYAMSQDCITIDGEYYHETQDEEDYIYDEIDECYILSSDSIRVQDRRHDFYTHCGNGTSAHDIYEYNDEFYTLAYIEYQDEIVFDCNGDLVHRDDVYYWECDGSYHYEPEDDEDEDDDDIDASVIHNYSYKPHSQFISMPYDNKNAPFFGIELEVEKMDKSETGRSDMARKIENKHWYFKNDGSLNNGFEIVTHPLTFSYIKHSAREFENALNELSNNAYNSYNANTCGMHIHISKKAFGTWQLYKFMKFFAENVPFIVAISQRKLEKLTQWANIEDNDENALMYKAKKKDGNNKRYVAINLQNYSTIEVRIFRGTLNFASFMKNIEFVHALYMFTKESKIITLDAFKQYITNSCEYSNLKKFIKLKNL